jgi:plastocyanin
VAVSGATNIVAEAAEDTLNIAAGTGISITTNPTTDTLTISSTASAGVSSFNLLSDAQLASLTVNRFYLPAITMLVVSNSGASAYRFDQYGTLNNPTIYAINGTTIAFDLRATGHPFLIQTGAGTNYSTGLFHVASDGTVLTGAAAQGQSSGILYWKIPSEITGGYRYQCSVHTPMVGSILIKNFSSI